MKTLEQLLAEMRATGWVVAVHNDYRLGGLLKTFWLFTHGSGLYLKGEGTSDVEVLRDLNKRRQLINTDLPPALTEVLTE